MGSRFSEQADLYAKYRPHYPQELYDIIFNHLQATERAWDCATGSGQVARVLSTTFDSVIATDISKEQLSHAPSGNNITYSVAAAEKSGLPANHFERALQNL
ncbi:class I SAM-dependent methyltransferase [Fodinibius halophilus]|uniref:Class I SAM-dependent methyltransferase n=1 Tax=Fodinibius halophilus TaxID=1736908 RepID=A0A6M1T1R4_9BACT|nr:methyltransferase domain-containing protein [Fodinibius halophilus]NGP87947.1 class I SAM-dependent methyltransferase [Fodinibius halophilus]